MGTKSKKNKKEKKKKRIRGAAAKNRAEKHKSGFQSTSVECPEGTERFKEKAGKPYRLDIIPFVLKESNDYADKGEQYYEKTIWVHFNIGADRTPYICRAKMLGEKCPICQFRAKMSKDEDADEKLLKDLAPKQRQLFRVIDTKDRDNKGIQLWEISFHNFGKMLDARVRNCDEDDRYNEFYELENGFTLRVAFAEESFGTNKFPKAESIDFKPREKDYDDDMLEEGPDLDECVKILDFDELKEIFLQTADVDDDDDGKKDKTSKKDKDKDEDPDEDNSGDDDNWEKNDRVIVEVNGEDFPGKISSIDDDDKTANIKFDDGDEMEDVAFDDLQAEQAEPEPEKKDKGKKEKGKKEKDKKEKGKSGKKCPGGGTFGKDTDRLTECPDCPKWDACDDAD